MAERFNEPQTSRILAGISHIDKLLIDIEQIISASSSPALPSYKNPLTPAQTRTAGDYIRRLRQQITHVLKDLAISVPEPKFDSMHSIRVVLQFIEIALEELAPERLSGYGAVSEHLRPRVAGGLQEMKSIARQMDSYLVRRPDANLSSRLNGCSDAALTELLKILAAMIDRNGLVEFCDPLSRLVEKIETPAYEIAVFGRVSAGKSSLLNRLIGIELLPTGVTPITAVPTRLRNRANTGLSVWTADGQVTRYNIDRLADFVTEARNPGNDKRVTRVVAELPLPIFPEDVVLVDTPGLGTLALEGAAETLAYLPHCDLGIVLVDASSNLSADDVATLDVLRAASVPSLLVLSKADLLGPDDLEQLLDYTRKQIKQQLGTPIEVAPMSNRPEMSYFVERWVVEQVGPRIANARKLAEQSNERKAIALAERVLHGLELSAKADSSHEDVASDEDFRRAESQLREAARLVESTRDACFQTTDRIRAAADETITVLADNAITIWQTEQANDRLNDVWIAAAVNRVAQHEAQELAGLIQDMALKLSEALDLAAKTTTPSSRNDRYSLELSVKEMPPPDFSGCAIDLPSPQLLYLSRSLTRRVVTRKIETACRIPLVRFFQAYGRALESWFRSTLDNLEGEFNSSAEVYRAQLQRLLAPNAAQLPANLLLEDIYVLKRKLGLLDMVERTDAPATV